MPRADESRRKPSVNQNQPGPIGGLLLPAKAWYVLRRERINNLDRLRAVADHLEQFDGIGPKMAQVIRAELARAASPDKG